MTDNLLTYQMGNKPLSGLSCNFGISATLHKAGSSSHAHGALPAPRPNLTSPEAPTHPLYEGVGSHIWPDLKLISSYSALKFFLKSKGLGV